MYPLISVVVPVYNIMDRMKFMTGSLNKQNYGNLEVIFVNDASTDGSAACLRGIIAGGVPYDVSVIDHDKNEGVSAARNAGLKAAKGEYVVFVDGDDMLEPGFVSTLYETISKSGGDYAACGYKTLEANDGKEEKHPLSVSPDIGSEEILIGRILNKIEISHWATLFRRDFLIENGLFYEEGCTAGEDIEFVIKMLCRSRKASFFEGCLYIYVQHESMGSRKEIKDNEKKIERYLHHTEVHFREAEYIKKYTDSKKLYTLAEHMILPQAYQRLLSVCAMKNDRIRFDEMLGSREIRTILFNSYKSFCYKPEVFLRSCVVLYLPGVYYKKYSNY